jgi:DNA recombination protein RmuC
MDLITAALLSGGFLAGLLLARLMATNALSQMRSRADVLQGSLAAVTAERDGLLAANATNQSLETLLAPVQKTVADLEAAARQAEERRLRVDGELDAQMKQITATNAELQTTNIRIVRALTDSASRGRWGEMQLERLFEFAGMIKGVHYQDQTTSVTDGVSTRPDFVVSLATGGKIFIDAKFPFDSYWNALAADSVEQRDTLMKAHAKAVADRAKALGNKSYHATESSSPDFVVMFLPFESLLYSALEYDEELLTKVFSSRVVIATPSTMMGLLHTVTLGNNQKMSAENAAEIRDVAVTLLDRFRVFAEHLNKVDAGLNSAVFAFGAMKSSLNSRVVPQIEQMQRLGIAAPKAIPMIGDGTTHDDYVIEREDESPRLG